MRAILTKVSDERYIEICQRMQQYGFNSMYEFISAIVGMALLEMSRMDYRKVHPEEKVIEDEIDEMFSPLNNWETPRYGERCKRSHDKWDKFDEQNVNPLQMTFDFEDEEDDGEG